MLFPQYRPRVTLPVRFAILMCGFVAWIPWPGAVAMAEPRVGVAELVAGTRRDAFNMDLRPRNVRCVSDI